MARPSWENLQRNLSNLVDSRATERNIYITATKTNSPDSQRLPTTLFHLVFGIIHRTRSDTDPVGEAQVLCLSEDFDNSFDRFASPEEAKAVVASMFSHQQTPFSLDTERGQNLLWKERVGHDTSGADRVLLDGFDDVVARISEAATRVARDAAASGRRAVQMAVTIDKRTAIPQHEFESLSTAVPITSGGRISDPEDPLLYDEIDARYTSLFFFTFPSFHLAMSPLYRHGLWEDDAGDGDELNRSQGEISRVIEQSFSQSMATFEPVPVSKLAVEASEKFVYDRSSEDEDESKLITCMVCMEDVTIGSHVTRFPCPMFIILIAFCGGYRRIILAPFVVSNCLAYSEV